MSAKMLIATIVTVTIGIATAFLWRDDRESFRVTWQTVAEGIESPPLAGTIAIWDAKTSAMRFAPALPLALARVGGPAASSATYCLFVALLGVAWMFGVRRLARAVGAPDGVSWAVGALAALAVARIADGRIAVLGAAPALWLVAGALGRQSPAGTTVAWVALGFLSRPALALSIPLGILAGLLRGERSSTAWWLAVAVATGLYLCLPRPDWVHVLRSAGAAHLSLDPGELAILGDVGTASRAHTLVAVAGAALLWVGGFVAASRARPLGPAVLLVALALTAAVAPPLVGFPSLLKALSIVFTELKLHAVAPVASSVALAALAALGTRAPSLALAGLALLAAATPESWRTLPPPPLATDLVRAAERVDRALLALPLTPANDRRWRDGLPARGELRNGLQRLLTKNAAVLAEELDVRDPQRIRALMAALEIEHVVVAAEFAGAIGEVLFTAGGESLVRVNATSEDDRPCRTSAGWTASASTSGAASPPRQAVDGNLATRWGTGAPQHPGQTFEIDFGEEIDATEVSLLFGHFASDRPRGLEVAARSTNDDWRVIWSREPWLGELHWNDGVAFRSVAAADRVRVPLAGVRTRALRFLQTGRTSRHDWSIAEVCLR